MQAHLAEKCAHQERITSKAYLLMNSFKLFEDVSMTVFTNPVPFPVTTEADFKFVRFDYNATACHAGGDSGQAIDENHAMNRLIGLVYYLG
jgi:hypothetical protein